MKKNVYGYVRVSTREQNVERQLIALKKWGFLRRAYLLIGKAARTFRGRLTRG